MKIARIYGIESWIAWLPTGPECIIEALLEENEITDRYGLRIRIVLAKLTVISLILFPIINIIAICCYLGWRTYIHYSYILPIIYPDTSDWSRLGLAIIPTILYYKIWRC